MSKRKIKMIASLNEQVADRFFNRRSTGGTFILNGFENESLKEVHDLLTNLDELEIDALVSFIKSFDHYKEAN